MKRIKRLARRLWLPLTLVVVVTAIVVLLDRLALLGYQVGWTGFAPSPNFPKARPITIAQPPKQLWDWLQLISALLVPVVVAGVGVWFTHRLRQTETEIAKDRQQEDDLLAYLDRMSDLLIQKHLATHESTHEVRLVARVLTTTALRQLLTKRRRDAVLRFLTAADLINTPEWQHRATSQDPPVESFLRGANLRWIDWSKAPLAGTDLRGADLTGADLTEADLTEADLTGADLAAADLTAATLRGAKLGRADRHEAVLAKAKLGRADRHEAILIKAKLGKADLSGANLSGVNLSGANLAGADLSGANLSGANLSGANLAGAGLSWADLRDAVLTGANLRKANLSDASLRKIQLGEAKLDGADLTGADLTGATLRGAKVTNEQLNTAQSLAGVILPKGCKLPDDFKGRLPYDRPPTPGGTPPAPPPPAP